MARHPDKVRENRLRAMAKRQGLELMKSRRRDPRAVDYGGYMLAVVDDIPGYAAPLWSPVYGDRYSITLDQAEAWLMSSREDRIRQAARRQGEELAALKAFLHGTPEPV